MEVSRFPAIVNVNVCRGRCPCKCVHCPVGIVPPYKRAQVFGESEMSLECIRSIIDQMAAYRDLTALRIHSVGEPLLWSRLADAVSYAHEKRVTTWIFTSAAIDSPELYNMLIKNADIVEVSVNSTSAEDYGTTKGIDAFSLVERNIRYMSGLKENNRLVLSRVQSADKEHDERFVSFWKQSGLADDAFIRSFHNYNSILDAPGTESKSKYQPCLVHFARFNIDTDGMAVVCFNELFKYPRAKAIELGNVLDSPIRDIWSGEKLGRIRSAALSGDFRNREGLYCPECTYCQPLNTGRTTSEFQIGKLREVKK